MTPGNYASRLLPKYLSVSHFESASFRMPSGISLPGKKPLRQTSRTLVGGPSCRFFALGTRGRFNSRLGTACDDVAPNTTNLNCRFTSARTAVMRVRPI